MNLDIDYLKSLESSLEEWNSKEDNENFKHLQKFDSTEKNKLSFLRLNKLNHFD